MLIAIHTYGSQRVSDPRGGRTVSAYKIGYTGAGRDALLMLYGDQARDVSSKRSTYHYVAVDAETTIRHGYLLMKISDEQRTQLEALTKAKSRSSIYRWQDGAWQLFPSQSQHNYTTVTGGSGPRFDPGSLRVVNAATGQKEAAITGIVVEKSQHDPDKTPWYWLRGDTYPHRETLRRYGGRWSKRQKAWYFIREDLPDAVQQLVDAVNAEQPSAPEPPPEKQPEPPPETEIPEGTTSYNVRYRTFTSTRHANIHAVFTRQIVYQGEWMSRREYVEVAHQHGLPMRKGEQKADENPTFWIGQRSVSEDEFDYLTFLCDQTEPCSLDEASAVLGVSLAPAEPQAPESESIEADENAEVSNIRIIQPEADETLQAAIQSAKAAPLTINAPTQKRTLTCIPQAPCGELSGSVTGQVWCYGWAMHEDVCVYVNLGGPRMAVEAIRARFSRSETVNLIRPDSPSIELTAGEGNTGLYADFMQTIPEAKFTSLILVHQMLMQPNYGGLATTFIIRTDEAQAVAKLRQHVTALVKVPVFEAWSGYLWQAGQAAQLLRPTRSDGGIDLWTVTLDVDAWTRLITGGLSQHIIQLPT